MYTRCHGHDEAESAIRAAAVSLVADDGAGDAPALWGIWDVVATRVVLPSEEYDEIKAFDYDGHELDNEDVCHELADDGLLADVMARALGWAPDDGESDDDFCDGLLSMSDHIARGRFMGEVVLHAIEDGDFDGEVRCVSWVWGLSPQSIFLTYHDAETHLRYNAYHYHQGAHVMRLAPWRSPELEGLLDALAAEGGAAYLPPYTQQRLDLDVSNDNITDNVLHLKKSESDAKEKR